MIHVLVNKCVVAGESARPSLRINVGSPLSIELAAEDARALVTSFGSTSWVTALLQKWSSSGDSQL